jgi:hypothetical protein
MEDTCGSILWAEVSKNSTIFDISYEETTSIFLVSNSKRMEESYVRNGC